VGGVGGERRRAVAEKGDVWEAKASPAGVEKPAGLKVEGSSEVDDMIVMPDEPVVNPPAPEVEAQPVADAAQSQPASTNVVSLADWQKARAAAVAAIRKEGSDAGSDEQQIEAQIRKLDEAIKAAQRELEAALYQLNGQYFVATQGTQTSVWRIKPGGPPEPMSVAAFHQFYANWVITLWRPHQVSKDWFCWQKRATCREVLLDPSGQPGKQDLTRAGNHNKSQPDSWKRFNIWQGLAMEPSEQGSCERYKHHLLNHVCGGVQEYYDYLWKWLAKTVQQPWQLPGVAVVVWHKYQGTGKTMVGVPLLKFFGACHATEPDPSDFNQNRNFNYHLRGKIFQLVNELNWQNNEAARNRLFSFITQQTLHYEPKGLDKVVDQNFSHLMITSNRPHVVPAERGDRRFFVLEVKTPPEWGDVDNEQDWIDKQEVRLAYFDALFDELDNGGYEKLLWELLATDLSEFDPRNRPATEALKEQQRQNMSQLEDWWFGLLQEGALPSIHFPEQWDMVRGRELHENYLRYLDKRRSLRPVDRLAKKQFDVRVAELLPRYHENPENEEKAVERWIEERPYVRVSDGHCGTAEGRVRHWKLPSLERCRAAWVERYGPVAWGD
jgi:hypothetical protein